MKQTKSNKYVLNIGDLIVIRDLGEIICYGLGSCVGLFLYDKFQNVGGGAHVAFPVSKRRTESEVILSEIINGMLNRGSSTFTMRAKIVGGANVMNVNPFDVGQRNIEYIKSELKKWGIVLQAEHTGGTVSRTARFSIPTGELSLSMLNKKRYRI